MPQSGRKNTQSASLLAVLVYVVVTLGGPSSLPAQFGSNAAPIVDSFTATPNTLAPGEIASLSVAASDPDCSGTCIDGCGQYLRSDLTSWSVTGGVLLTTDNGTSASPYSATAIWQAPLTEGIYTVTIQLSDSGSFMCGSRESTSASVDIQVTLSTNPPPEIQVLTAEPSAVFLGAEVALSCTAIDPEGEEVSYSWTTDLGAITQGTQGAATFASSDPGTATIECRAEDAAGGFDARTVLVAVEGARASNAVTAGVINPQRVAVDSMADIYIADRISGGLTVHHLFSGELIYRLPLAGVRGVAVDWQDRLLVGGRQNARLIERDGTPLLTLQPPSALGEVFDVDVDSAGQRYGVLYGESGTVVIYDSAGQQVERFGSIGTLPDQFRTPLGLAADGSGNWIVADSGGGLLKVFSRNGTLIRTFGEDSFVQLADVAVDAGGIAYVPDTYQGRVLSFNIDGSFREVIGSFGEGVGELQTPTGVASSANFSRLLITSVNGLAVQVFATSDRDLGILPEPVANLSKSSLVFPSTQIGLVSSEQTARLSNTGTSPLGLRSLRTIGDFLTTHNCGLFLDPGVFCTLRVRMQASTPGVISGQILLDTSAGGEELEIALSGTAFRPADLRLSQESLFFAEQEVGTISSPQTVVLSNIGDAPATFFSIQSTGDYQASDTCSSSLAGGSSCLIEVAFAPQSPGADQGGLLTFLSNAPGSPHSLVLSGSATYGPLRASAGEPIVNESDGSAIFPITLSRGDFPRTVRIAYATQPATALPGRDYESVTGEIEFAIGVTELSITIPILEDAVLEEDEETFSLVLTSADVVFDNPLPLATILDDEICPGPNDLINGGAELDAPATGGWSILGGGSWQAIQNGPEAVEGETVFASQGGANPEMWQEIDLARVADRIDSGIQTVTFVGYFQTQSDSQARILVEYLDSTGSVVLDRVDTGLLTSVGSWQAMEGSLLLPEGTRAARFHVIGHSPSGGDAEVFFDALDLHTERIGWLSVTDASQSEGNFEIVDSTFTFDLACALEDLVSVSWGTADGTATSGEDFLPVSGLLVFTEKQLVHSVAVPIVGDEVVEEDEAYTLTVVLEEGRARLARPSARGSILDNDARPGPLSFSPAHISFGEVEIGTMVGPISVSLTNDGELPAKIRLIEAQPLLHFGPNYDCGSTLEPHASCNVEVYFAPETNGVISGTISVHSDAIDTPHALSVEGVGLATNGFLISDSEIIEGSASDAIFQVRLLQALPTPSSVTFRTVEGTAVAGEDFIAKSGVVSFAAGEVTREIAITILDDGMLEPDSESFTLELLQAIGSSLVDATAIATILDNELCPSWNLALNAGADDFPVGGTMDSWTETPGSDFSASETKPWPHRGRRYFAAGGMATSEMYQDVDISTFDFAVDGNRQFFQFRGFVHTSEEVGDADTARIVVEYRDQSGSSLESFDSGSLQSRDLWREVVDQRLAPFGTRVIRIRLIGERFSGEKTDAFFDSIELVSIGTASMLVEPAEVIEGDSGVSPMAFRVQLACTYYQDVGVEVSTTPITATPGEDYLPSSTFLDLVSGTLTRGIEIGIVGDELAEGLEELALEVVLTQGDVAMLTTSTRGSIVDDDLCRRSASQWSSSPSAWPVPWLEVGGIEYGEQGLQALLAYQGFDPMSQLARENAAAQLNLALGTDPIALSSLEVSDDILTELLPGVVFMDGFELGNTRRWQEVGSANIGPEILRYLTIYNTTACDPISF